MAAAIDMHFDAWTSRQPSPRGNLAPLYMGLYMGPPDGVLNDVFTWFAVSERTLSEREASAKTSFMITLLVVPCRFRFCQSPLKKAVFMQQEGINHNEVIMPVLIILPSGLLAMAAMEDLELEPVSGPVAGPVGEDPRLLLLPLLANLRGICLLTDIMTLS